MSQVSEQQLSVPVSDDCCDPRVLLLNSRLHAGVAYLESLRIDGVAKTNFMQCDERSIYVLEYLFTSPLKIVDAPMPSFRRSHNHTMVMRLVDLLNSAGEADGAAALTVALEECDPFRISDAQASTELRVCYMIEMHALIFGLLREVLGRSLSFALEKDTSHIYEQSRLPDACRPNLAYVSKERLVSLLADTLSNRGLHRASELVACQKGRTIW